MKVKVQGKEMKLNQDKWLSVKGMQFFSEPDPVDPVDPKDPADPKDPEVLTFTQSELDSLMDKRLDKALKTARSKWETEFSTKLEEEKKEAERLAKLSQKERENEELNKRENELNNRLKELERRELKADTIKVLNENELPATFADFLLAEDDKTTFDNIKSFKAEFDKAIEEAVNTRLKGSTPKGKASTVQSTDNVTNFAELAQKNRLVGK